MRKLLFVVAFASALGSIGSAAAQVYPSRPITVIVPFAAGGPLDTTGRILAERMRMSLGQPVIIENVGAAQGSVGVGRVARAAPDGYAAVYVVARFCPLLLSFFVESPSWSTRGISLRSILS